MILKEGNSEMMKYRKSHPPNGTKRSFVLFFGVFSFVIALLIAGRAQAETRTVVVGHLPLNLRTGPGITFPSIAELRPGEPLTVMSQSGEWLNVLRGNGQAGWVHGDYVATPGSGAGPTPASPAVGSSVIVDTGMLNIRAGPGLAYPPFAELPSGELLKVLGRTGSWLSVQRPNGQIGWVNAGYVKPAPAPAPVATPSPVVPVTGASGIAVVNTPFLNLRSGPGITFPSLAQMPEGEKLTITGQSGGWLRVKRSNGQEGWSNRGYLKVSPAFPAPGPFCRPGDVLAGVHNPSRLRVLNACLSVSGFVREVSRSDDGDITFRLQVDPAFDWVLNAGNRNSLRGFLQVEIIPADQAAVAAPSIGAHVSVTGAFVEDTPKGWNEIHPVWHIAALP